MASRKCPLFRTALLARAWECPVHLATQRNVVVGAMWELRGEEAIRADATCCVVDMCSLLHGRGAQRHSSFSFVALDGTYRTRCASRHRHDARWGATHRSYWERLALEQGRTQGRIQVKRWTWKGKNQSGYTWRVQWRQSWQEWMCLDSPVTARGQGQTLSNQRRNHKPMELVRFIRESGRRGAKTDAVVSTCCESHSWQMHGCSIHKRCSCLKL